MALGRTKPTNESYDYTTKGGNGKWKQVIVEWSKVEEKKMLEDEEVVVWIGVWCGEKGGCLGQIEVDYEGKEPKRIYSS